MAHFLLGGDDGSEHLDFWDGESGEIRFYGLFGGIASKAEFEECEVKFKDVNMKNAKASKFVFEPITGGKISLKLRVQLNPTDAQLTKLSHYQKKGGKLAIKTDSLFDPIEGEQEMI